ncbi:hypothetical protein Thiowin_02714 [Thiorhodovibrio winogradskyi]|uniref:Uncharacterized protein n=1 Tax=Thiorhodovibrio winogradskyi TaxID=77007 RepID=A0ABZ0S9G9_9GAMM
MWKKMLERRARAGNCLKLPFALWSLLPLDNWAAHQYGVLRQCEREAAETLLRKYGTELDISASDVTHPGRAKPC